VGIARQKLNFFGQQSQQSKWASSTLRTALKYARGDFEFSAFSNLVFDLAQLASDLI
jgi:hypothetical protein